MDKRGKSPYAGSWTLWQKRRVKTKVCQFLSKIYSFSSHHYAVSENKDMTVADREMATVMHTKKTSSQTLPLIKKHAHRNFSNTAQPRLILQKE